ncbi:uncharacterized protein V1478_007165 [Vespula squamosa]|uniref:Uncharacterized protein n=1 Tax=Vespula squamosa TaxID=30214 RepID=A0ABD2B2D3_VESSQ
MCNCKHSTAVGGEGHRCPGDPSISAIGSRWESRYDESDSFPDSSYRTQSSFRGGRSFRTPPIGVATVVPSETLQRSIADTPELAEGVAIVRRRLDFDDPTFDETQGGCGACPRKQTRRSGMTSSSCPMGNISRTARSPCGKCSKVIQKLNKFIFDRNSFLYE